MKYYTYAYLREDKSPYYIGKGCGRRLYDKSRNGVKPPQDKSKVIFLKQNLTEEEAFKHEIYMIAIFGRKDLGTGILLNMTDGGEGKSGWIPSKKWRENKSNSMLGENNPFFGKSHSAKTKQKISDKNRGKCAGKNNYFYCKRYIGKENAMFGKKRPDLAKRNKENPSSKGTKWYNNGTSSIRCKEGQQPDGFILGRLISK